MGSRVSEALRVFGLFFLSFFFGFILFGKESKKKKGCV